MLETHKVLGAILEEYIYVFIDPRRSGKFSYENVPFSCLYEPFYVGKGSKDRPRYHLMESRLSKDKNLHKVRKIRKIIKETGKNPPFFCFPCKSVNEAFSLEEKIIESIGRSCTNLGPLTNITVGGLGNRGVPRSEETKKKQSKSMKTTLSEEELSSRSPTKGRKRTEEEKDNISKSQIGKIVTEESKEKMRKAHSGVPLSKSHSENISKALKGKPHSKEWNKKVGKALKGKPKSEEHKQKLREASLRYYASKKKQS